MEPADCVTLKTTRTSWTLPDDKTDLNGNGNADTAAALIAPGQDYTLRVRAENSEGPAAYSSIVETPPADRPATMFGVSKSPPPPGFSASTTLTVTWTEPESHGIPIEKYELKQNDDITDEYPGTTFQVLRPRRPRSLFSPAAAAAPARDTGS